MPKPAPANPGRGDRTAEPSTLPAGIGALTLIFFCLIAADLGCIGGLLAQATDPVAGEIAPMLGVCLGIVYGCYPLQYLDGRATIALAGYRLLLWALLVLHIPLVIILALDFRAGMSGTVESLFLTAPVSVFATPGLYLIGKALRNMRWLDQNAPIETWETMPGIDGPARAEPRQTPRLTTPAAIALALPFVAAFRARQPGLAACAALLWLGGWLMIAFTPWRAVLMFCVAGGIGQRTAASALREAASGPAEQTDIADREHILRSIFTPARLAAAPRFAAAGLLCLPCLFIIDFIALTAFLALPDCNSVPGLLAALHARFFILLMLLAFIFIPGMFFLPLGTRAAKFTFRAVALVLALSEIALALLYAAISFHLDFSGHDIYVPAAVYPVFWPITFGLLASVPPALITSAAVITYGRVANLLAFTDMRGEVDAAAPRR